MRLFIGSRGPFAAKDAQQTKKFQFREERPKPFQTKTAGAQVIELNRKRQVGSYRGEGAAEKRDFPAVRQKPAQSSGAANLEVFDFIEAREKIFQRTKFLNQRHRGFRADAPDAWNVIDRIAHEAHHFDDQLGSNAELLPYLRRAYPASARPIVKFDAVADELHQILVG